MKAIVKKIKIGTVVETKEHLDVFVCAKEMSARRGKIIDVIKKPNCPEWYESNEFNFHESWLTFIKPKKAKKQTGK